MPVRAAFLGELGSDTSFSPANPRQVPVASRPMLSAVIGPFSVLSLSSPYHPLPGTFPAAAFRRVGWGGTPLAPAGAATSLVAFWCRGTSGQTASNRTDMDDCRAICSEGRPHVGTGRGGL